MISILLLILSFALLTALLTRRPRRVEGLLLAYLLPCLVFFAYVTWNSKTARLDASGVNINKVSAAELSQATSVSLDITDQVIKARDAQGRFTSVSALPVLGRASDADKLDILRLAKKKDWKTLRKVVFTGEIPDSARPGLIGKAIRAVKSGETQASGIYPSLDLRVRAARALPNDRLDLAKSSRAVLVSYLQDESVVDRIIQFRTNEWIPAPGEVLQISDIPAVPKENIVLRTQQEAFSLYWSVVITLAAAILCLHLYLRWRKSQADEMLLPLMGGLGLLAIIMLFSVSSPLKVPAAVQGLPALWGAGQPKYIGQAIAVFLGLAMLPFAYKGVRFIESSAKQEIIALAAVAPLAANAFARWGVGAIPAILVVGAIVVFGLHRLDKKEAAKYAAAAVIVIAVLAAGRILIGKSGYAPFIEFAKFALIIYIARLCAEHDFFFGGRLRSLPSSAVIQFLSVWGVALILTMLSRDMGVLLLLWIPCILLLGFAFSRREVLAGIALLLIGGKIIEWLSLGPFPNRVAMWLNPWNYVPVGGYSYSSQMAQAYHRMASVPNPIAGTGLGRSTPADIATNTQDVIMPMYYEQLGFVGVVLVMAAFLVIIYRLFKISLSSRDRFAHWLGLGFAGTLGVQTVYIIGANFGAWPLTGVTLAPLAFGKAACLTAFVMVWVLLGISESAVDGVAGFVPQKRKRTVAWVFAALAILSIYSVGKAFKIGVIDREFNALAHYGPDKSMNSRVAAKLAVLPKGRILARTDSTSYNSVKVLAETSEDGERRIYYLGPAAWPVVGVSCPYGVTGGEQVWRSRLTGAYDLVQKGPLYGSPQNVLETALLSQWRAEQHPLWPARSQWQDKLVPQDVQTTIVASLQAKAYERLKNYLSSSLNQTKTRPRKGAILIADVRTGEYLAKVQFPSVDPNALASGWMSWDRYAHDPCGYLDPNGQMIDLVDNTDRAPGSTAKLNTILALLMAGEGGRKFWCGPGVKVNGHVINDFHDANHGWVDAEKIIKYSCNRGAAQAAEVVGARKLASLYREKLRYSLPHIDRPSSWFRKNYDKISFGQTISASLSEMMVTLCAIARGGQAIELHSVRKPKEEVERWKVCGPNTASALTRYMVSAAKPGGTAYVVYKGAVAWPSKTGSAEVAGAKKTDAWFVGFAPADNPRVAFVLWVEEDGTGGNMASNLGVMSLVGQALAATKE